MGQMQSAGGSIPSRQGPRSFNQPGEIQGLRPIETQNDSLQPAMRFLQDQNEFPYNMGWSRETRLGTPTHLSGDAARGSMGWRVGGTDVINVNKDHPFYGMAQSNKDVVPLLASILYHENEHVGGADESQALQKQAGLLGRVKNNPMALKAAEIFGRLGRQDVVGTQ